MTTGEAVPLALSWLATYWLHSTLFLGGAWLLSRARPPKIARDRERVWKLALVGGVLSATLQLGLVAKPLLGGFELRPAQDDATEAPENTASRTPLEPARDEQHPVSLTEVAALAPASEHPSAPVSMPAVRERPRAASPARIERPAPESSRRAAARVPERRDTVSIEELGSPPPRASDTHEPLLEPLEPTTPGATLAATTRALHGRWPGLVVALWSTIGLLGVTGLLASWTCLRRRMLGRELLRDGALLERFEHLSRRAGMKRRVRLTLSSRIASPFSTGWLRPEVCLPHAVLTDLSSAQQDALLAHELGHLVRRDPVWFGLGSLIEKLFFFQPLNRLARRRLSELAEEACDDWAVRWTGARLALASCLTEVAGWVVGEERRLLAPPALAGYRSRLGQRVARLLDDRRSPSGEPPAPWWPPLAAGALALVTLAVPGVSAGRAEAAASPSTPALTTAIAPSRAPAPESIPIQVPAPTVADTEELPLDLAVQRGVLASELTLLELELTALHAELEACALRERFEGELGRIDARMAGLREQHRRVSELLEHLSEREACAGAPNTPTCAPAPAGAPAETESETDESQGESR